ncbi:TIM-barrel domain-containing protein [uncultured Cohaesibacter sp.]|uniref:glycoside hydrolase family 31 protein n=1 Tax=uncultured Cohaesibacter sp. TaxID=1002546 RepID=UPI0029C7FF58|nr:TIM-barrel domain-containing protein [uncultured Cohaesibacter sp.]
MYQLKQWSLQTQTETGVILLIEGRHAMHIDILEERIIRVQLLKDGMYRLNRSWTVAPGGNAPIEGRNRASLDGFSCPTFNFDNEGETLRLGTGLLRVIVKSPLGLVWEARANVDAPWEQIAEDRPTGAYMLGRKDHAHSHFLRRTKSDRFYGLGEKAGELERSGRRFEMRNLDAMGYNASTTDPLYKHIPFTITRLESGLSYSLFYDNLAPCWFDLGNELDNYHLPYRAYRADDGDLDYYFTLGPTISDLSKAQVRLTGGTAFLPRWSLGYSGSTMTYTDADNAQEQLEGFVRLVKEHDIPCDSFQLSSGYTSIGPKRYVFNWNTDKVPDAHGMARTFADAGIELIANIKPCLLQDHPRYGEADGLGLFVRDGESGRAERSVFWDDEGSHLDFTNPATQDWWKGNVKSALLEYGINSTWNDNNEYEIWDRQAQCWGFGVSIDIDLIRPVQPLLMTRASNDAQIDFAPQKRPYLISRSGCPGIQRYAQTWSGDNRTNWNSLKYNIPMGLGMSLSGLYNIGHDVGGFAGDRPDPELFVRWVQNGIFHPRFTIHSWNDDKTVNEPWMYPEVTDHIRNAIKLRYTLLPYLYTLLYKSVVEDEAMIRPTFLDHEHDARCFEPTDDFFLGRDLLVANVVEEGATERTVYLPDNGVGYYDFWSGDYHAGGQEITVPVDLGSIPLFVRAGAILPLSPGVDRSGSVAGQSRVLVVYPYADEATYSFTSELYEDGVDNVDALSGMHRLTRINVTQTATTLDITWAHEGQFDPALSGCEINLCSKTSRSVTAQGKPYVLGTHLDF